MLTGEVVYLTVKRKGIEVMRLRVTLLAGLLLVGGVLAVVTLLASLLRGIK